MKGSRATACLFHWALLLCCHGRPRGNGMSKERAGLTPGETDVLIVADVQYDFLPGGALAVPDGDAVIEPINRLARAFRHVVLTQDWHPEGHASFASSHSAKQPFEMTDLHYGPQVLWPDHCVQGSSGAEISQDLDIPHAQLVIRKGYKGGIDSFPGSKKAARQPPPGLGGFRKNRETRRFFCAGLALVFGVAG